LGAVGQLEKTFGKYTDDQILTAENGKIRKEKKESMTERRKPSKAGSKQEGPLTSAPHCRESENNPKFLTQLGFKILTVNFTAAIFLSLYLVLLFTYQYFDNSTTYFKNG
jgi:hypothetical protein